MLYQSSAQMNDSHNDYQAISKMKTRKSSLKDECKHMDMQLNIKTCILFTTMMPFCLIWKTEPSQTLMNDVSAVYTMIHSTMWYMPIQSTVQIAVSKK